MHHFTPIQPKVAIFDKTDFLGLKYPPEVQVEPKTCSTICGTPVPAILNHKNSTGSAGGAKKTIFVTMLYIGVVSSRGGRGRYIFGTGE